MDTYGKVEAKTAAFGARDVHPNDAKQCADCRDVAPPTDSNFTLISAQHGWRLSFEQDSEGKRSPVWRCPRCWKAHKARAKQGR